VQTGSLPAGTQQEVAKKPALAGPVPVPEQLLLQQAVA